MRGRSLQEALLVAGLRVRSQVHPMVKPARLHTRFERARIIGARALQIGMGAPLFAKEDDLRKAFREELISSTATKKRTSASSSTRSRSRSTSTSTSSSPSTSNRTTRESFRACEAVDRRIARLWQHRFLDEHGAHRPQFCENPVFRGGVEVVNAR